jgi:hypothetical protein
VHIRVLEEQNVVCKDKAIQSEAKGTCENELVKQHTLGISHKNS